MKAYNPQRFTMVTAEDEKKRCHATWKMFNSLIWTVAFGGKEDLDKHVVKVDEFIKNRTNGHIYGEPNPV